MRRNPIFVFQDRTSIGIYEVPLESIIQIVDSDGLGTPSMTQFVDKSLLYAGTTIDQYLKTPTAYIELDRYVEILNELNDVDLTSVVDGQILRFDSSTSNWINLDASSVASDINLSDLNDVPEPTSTEDGNYLEWDEAGNQWILVTSIKKINDLLDVNTSPTNNQMLSFTGTEWEAVDIDGGQF